MTPTTSKDFTVINVLSKIAVEELKVGVVGRVGRDEKDSDKLEFIAKNPNQIVHFYKRARKILICQIKKKGDVKLKEKTNF